MIAIVDIIILSILLYALGNYFGRVLFGEMKRINMRIGGIIFMQFLGIMFIFIGTLFDNQNILLSFQLAGLGLFVSTTYTYWNDLSLEYRFIILLSLIGYVIYDINNKSSIDSVNMSSNVINLFNNIIGRII